MVSYLLEKEGGISHLGRQIIKVLGFKGVGVEEFLNDISKLKRKYSYAFPWKLRIYLLLGGDCFPKSQRMARYYKG